jgi:hypothetical protein
MGRESPSPFPSLDSRRTPPRRGTGRPYNGEAERQRLLLRLQADVQQAIAEIAAVKVESDLLVELQAQRPLGVGEAARLRALSRKAQELRFRLQHLRAEFAQLQRCGN